MSTQNTIEPLEARQFLSTTVGAGTLTFGGITRVNGSSVTLSSGTLVLHTADDLATLTSRGTLVVHGTAQGDIISVTLKRGGVLVTRQQQGSTVAIGTDFDASQVKRILIEALGGNDRVGVSADIGRRCTLVGGSGDDQLSGSQGDVLVGGAGDDKLSISRDRPIGKGDIVEFRDDDQGNAILSGGDGNDTLAASINDTVVGGRGDDTAFFHRYLSSMALMVDIDPVLFARDAFGARAVGIEHFDTFTDRIPQQVFTLP